MDLLTDAEGLAALPLDVEIEADTSELDVEIVINPDGSAEIVVEREDEDRGIDALDHDDNLATVLPETYLMQLGSDILTTIQANDAARADWLRLQAEGVKYLGMRPQEAGPFESASTAIVPAMLRALTIYQADTIREVWPITGPAEIQTFGLMTPERKACVARVKAELNYLATTKMRGFRESFEGTLMDSGFAGSAFRKVYYDKMRRGTESKGVPARDLILTWGSANLMDSHEYTHVQTYDKVTWAQTVAACGWVAEPMPQAAPIQANDAEDAQKAAAGMEEPWNSTSFQVYEHYCFLFDSEVGASADEPLPFVVVVDQTHGKVRSIRRNWREDDPAKAPRDHIVQYQYLPGFTPYGLGLLHLLGGLTQAGTALLRQIIDAGTWNNFPGGFKSKTLRMNQKDASPIAPGEFRDVDATTEELKAGLMFLPTKQPDPTSFQLLDFVLGQADLLASAAAIKPADASAHTGAMMAVLERAMTVQSAGVARTALALGRELDLIRRCVADYGPSEYQYPQDGQYDRQADFALCAGVRCVADPNASSQALRVLRNQSAITMSGQKPEIYDVAALHRRCLEDMGFSSDDTAAFVPMADDIPSRDPISENVLMLQGRPVKAYLEQDHAAHIAVHVAAIQDPTIRAMVGQSATGPQAAAAAQAHILEHLALLYRSRMEQALGFPLPPPGEPLPADIENQIARLAAQAQVDMGLALPGAPEQQPDPMVLLRQQEMAIKAQEIQLRMAQIQQAGDTAARRAQVDQEREESRRAIALLDASIEEKRIETDAALTTAEIVANKQAKDADRALRAADQGIKAGFNAAEIDRNRAALERKDALDAAKIALQAENARQNRASEGE